MHRIKWRMLRGAFCKKHRLARLYTRQLSSSTSPIAGLKLRQYQEDCISTTLSYLQNGAKRLGISLATGAGKTVIFTQLIGRVAAPSKKATQTLILVHRRELVEQAAAHCSRTYPDQSVEIEMGNSHASGTADITIASIWSIVSSDRLEKFDPSRFKLILVDEAHHIVANSFMRALEHFGLLKDDLKESSPALVGVSATLSRFDGIRLSDALDHVVYHKDYVDMIGEKWLSDVIFTTLRSKADLSKVKAASTGDYRLGQLSQAVNTSEINNLTVGAWMSRASTRKSTLVFCVDLAHVSALAQCFRDHGIDARYISGKTPKLLRGDRLESFRNQEFPVMLNCGVFTEGTDIPNIDCVLLARPTRSRNLLVQMIGRGMRLHPDKENCHVIDLVASLDAGIVSTPTLFGLDPQYLVEEANVAELKQLKDTSKEDLDQMDLPQSSVQPMQTIDLSKKIHFVDYKSVYDLIDDASQERYIRGISKLAWVMVAHNRYVLADSDGSYLCLESDADDAATSSHGVFYHQKMSQLQRKLSKSKSPFLKTRQVAKALTFSDAVHAADTFASNKMAWNFVFARQAWRQAPASEAQVAFLNKVRPEKVQLEAGDITKGKANDMITKLKYGAKGWFGKLETSKRKEVKAKDKAQTLEDRQRREQVSIGPLA